MEENKRMKVEINSVIKDLEQKGIDVNAHLKDKNFGDDANTKGLGDLVEETLQKFGITEERFKQWFNLKECNCTKRKKWLNGLFKWKVTQGK